MAKKRGSEEKGVARGETPGIVIADGWAGRRVGDEPRISAFIWGGKVRPTPVLPFGRWKGAA